MSDKYYMMGQLDWLVGDLSRYLNTYARGSGILVSLI
jgi:hypothetical protein